VKIMRRSSLPVIVLQVRVPIGEVTRNNSSNWLIPVLVRKDSSPIDLKWTKGRGLTRDLLALNGEWRSWTVLLSKAV
jgi:hypothetical protein